MGQRTYTQDAELVFADGAAAVTADGISQVGGAAVTKQVGPGRFEAVMIVDVSAITVGADNVYNLIVQGGDADDFSGAVENLAMLELGNTAVRKGGADTSVVGRFEVPFQTEQADTVYDYIRLYADVAGTTPSITFKAYAGVLY